MLVLISGSILLGKRNRPDVDYIPFKNWIALNMANRFVIFIGRGSFIFATNNRVAAVLLIEFYPRAISSEETIELTLRH